MGEIVCPFDQERMGGRVVSACRVSTKKDVAYMRRKRGEDFPTVVVIGRRDQEGENILNHCCCQLRLLRDPLPAVRIGRWSNLLLTFRSLITVIANAVICCLRSLWSGRETRERGDTRGEEGSPSDSRIYDLIRCCCCSLNVAGLRDAGDASRPGSGKVGSRSKTCAVQSMDSHSVEKYSNLSAASYWH